MSEHEEHDWNRSYRLLGLQTLGCQTYAPGHQLKRGTVNMRLLRIDVVHLIRAYDDQKGRGQSVVGKRLMMMLPTRHG